MNAFALLAQETPPTQPGGILGSPTFPFLLMGLFLLFWVTVLLPQDRRRRKEQEELLKNIKPGTKVVTTSGIVGIVVTVKDGDDEVTLRSADAKIRVLRSSVARVVGEETADKT